MKVFWWLLSLWRMKGFAKCARVAINKSLHQRWLFAKNSERRPEQKISDEEFCHAEHMTTWRDCNGLLEITTHKASAAPPLELGSSRDLGTLQGKWLQIPQTLGWAGRAAQLSSLFNIRSSTSRWSYNWNKAVLQLSSRFAKCFTCACQAWFVITRSTLQVALRRHFMGQEKKVTLQGWANWPREVSTSDE